MIDESSLDTYGSLVCLCVTVILKKHEKKTQFAFQTHTAKKRTSLIQKARNNKQENNRNNNMINT